MRTQRTAGAWLRVRVATPWRMGVVGLNLALSVASVAAHAQSGPPYPRLANMYLQGAIDSADLPALARWDVLILDSSAQRATLAATPCLEPEYQDLPLRVSLLPAVAAAAVAHLAADELQLRQHERPLVAQLEPAPSPRDWPGSQLVNITELAAAGPQGTWRQYIAARVEQLDPRPSRSRRRLLRQLLEDHRMGAGRSHPGGQRLQSDPQPGRLQRRHGLGCAVDTLWNRALRTLAQDTRTRFDCGRVAGRPAARDRLEQLDRLLPVVERHVARVFPVGKRRTRIQATPTATTGTTKCSRCRAAI